MDSLWKETLIIKWNNTEIPSDFKRTEYIKYDENFSSNINKFFEELYKRTEHYKLMWENMENNPILSLDYYKRAYLIFWNEDCKNCALELFNKNEDNIDSNFKLHIKNFLKY